MAYHYDVVILGGGMGGYAAAFRASQLGLKTALVEKDRIGGTCLHRGCIPSKALLKSAEMFRLAKNAGRFGIEISNVQLNFNKIQTEKDDIVKQLHQGLHHLMKKNNVDLYIGKGRLLGPSIFSPLAGAVSVEMNEGKAHKTLIPKHVIIATGSKPRSLPTIPYDGKHVLSSDEALKLQELPDSIIIVGGGPIGVEWASMMSDFGVEVTLLEMASQLLPEEDEDVSKAITAHLEKNGVQIVTNANVLSHEIKNENVAVQYETGNERCQAAAGKVLISIGREAAIDDIGLENTEIKLKNKCIETNEMYQTAETHIYAVGDCIGGMQLAHVAAREGIIAAEHIAGRNPDRLKKNQIVKCVYSNPEIASIGLTEREAKENYNVKIGLIPFHSNGKALINRETEGFVKIIADADTDDLLGIHLFGQHATEMISEASLAKMLDATPWEISQVIHPHPSLSEIIGEAALAVDGKQLHY